MRTSKLEKEYDLVVAGGGITGAGVFHAATKLGYRVLLVECNDFSWGTSSRSSKMVHGGLRYLKQGKFLMTKAAVKEREKLLMEYPGLVVPLKFIMPVFDHYGPSNASMKIGLTIYSYMAGQTQHKNYDRDETINKIPGIRTQNLLSAVGFQDAQVDDARLVLRLIFDTCQQGGTALNYAKVTGIERDQKGYLAAVKIVDKTTGNAFEVKTKVLVNATGPFAEALHPSPMKGFHIRPLRGSHLIFPAHRASLDRVISFIHPKDARPVFLFPWESCIILGTTDVDHDQDIYQEPRVTQEEADYLMEGLHDILPGVDLSLNHCVSSIAGVRPILSKRGKEASRESREHVVWKDRGLITVTGGKLTTFRLLAKDAIKAALPYLSKPKAKRPEKETAPTDGANILNLSMDHQKRLVGRYGPLLPRLTIPYDKALFSPIKNTNNLWAELCYAAEHENIHHLSDLILRRVRIGLFLPNGAINLLDRIEALCKPYLSWDNKRWEKEKKEYTRIWKQNYSPPNDAN